MYDNYIYFTIFRGGLLSYLWNILEGISQITILSLIGVTIPGIAYQVNNALLNLGQLDILPSGKLEGSLIKFNPNDSALNHNFNALGYTTTNCI